VIKPPGICLRAIGVVISTAWPGSRRRFLLQALVRAVPVIVPGVPGQDAAQMPLAEDQHVVQALTGAAFPANRSADEFARGARTGVLITHVPFPEKSAPDAVATVPSRSRIKNLNPLARSPWSIWTLRPAAPSRHRPGAP